MPLLAAMIEACDEQEVVPMARCEIRLPYRSSETLSAALPDFQLVQIGDSETLLIGDLRDQTELHALLSRLADLGLDIAELRQER